LRYEKDLNNQIQADFRSKLLYTFKKQFTQTIMMNTKVTFEAHLASKKPLSKVKICSIKTVSKLKVKKQPLWCVRIQKAKIKHFRLNILDIYIITIRPA